MSAARVDGASTRADTETARGAPRRAGTQRYWVIAKDAKDRFGRPDLLTVDLDGTGRALPVFSFEEEAEMFLWLQTTEEGREVRVTTPEQLVSILYGPCADVGRVILDPLPEIGARMQNSLLGMDRSDFVASVMGARSLDTPQGLSRYRLKKGGTGGGAPRRTPPENLSDPESSMKGRSCSID